MQAGHFLPGRSDAVLFDDRGVNAQCYRCNILLQGAWPAYYRKMQEMYGQDWIEESIDVWQRKEKHYSDSELDSLLRFYQMKAKQWQRSRVGKTKS